MQGLNDLLKSLHGKYLAQFNLYRFIQQPAFHAAYKTADSNEQRTALRYIEEVNQSSLIIWTKEVLRRRDMFELLDVRYLRDLARDHGIKNYSVMGRLELIHYLRQRKESSRDEAPADRAEGGDVRVIGQIWIDQA